MILLTKEIIPINKFIISLNELINWFQVFDRVGKGAFQGINLRNFFSVATLVYFFQKMLFTNMYHLSDLTFYVYSVCASCVIIKAALCEFVFCCKLYFP